MFALWKHDAVKEKYNNYTLPKNVGDANITDLFTFLAISMLVKDVFDIDALKSGKITTWPYTNIAES